MPFQKLDKDFLVPNAEVLEQLRRLGEIRPCEDGNGPSAARSYEVRGFRGRIGLISPLTRPFCQGCDRLRLTADGKLHACLVEGGQMDVAPLLRNGLDVERLRSLLAQCMAMKPARHHGSFRGVMTYMGG
jgi:cyclic pyranopterin phosphate synthase